MLIVVGCVSDASHLPRRHKFAPPESPRKATEHGLYSEQAAILAILPEVIRVGREMEKASIGFVEQAYESQMLGALRMQIIKPQS